MPIGEEQGSAARGGTGKPISEEQGSATRGGTGKCL